MPKFFRLTASRAHRLEKCLWLLLASLIIFIIYFIHWHRHDLKVVSFLFDAPKKVPKPHEITDKSVDAFLYHFDGPKNNEQKQIVGAFLHAWKGYKRHAWGYDELKPLSKGWINWMGFGLTIVDSLDTLWIMGLKKEFEEARDWVSRDLTFSRDNDVQMFEVIIRVLGGLLSAYRLTADKMFLDKAIVLGSALTPCFQSASHIPCSRINLSKRSPQFGIISMAESGTIQLELRELSRASNIRAFETTAKSISDSLHRIPKYDGMVSNFVNEDGKLLESASITVGASADSYYEYLLKQWIQTGRKNNWLRDDYLDAIAGIQKHLLKYTYNRRLAFVGSYTNWKTKLFGPAMEHLACFLPGTLALGVLQGLNRSHLYLAEELMTTCYKMYENSETGLGPEIAAFGTRAQDKQDIFFKFDNRNAQRPETVESLYYLYLATEDPKYRQWGWSIFQAFQKVSKVRNGYASVDNVDSKNSTLGDKMESFFLAETLKYLFLLFNDDSDLLPVDGVVFNTEAHPLPIYDS